MKRPSLFSGLLLLMVLLFGCKDKDLVYDRPSWLSGKIYEQLSNRAELSIFKECVDRHSEYKDILAKTNLLTVFAPNNQAFEEYFATNPYGYKKVSDMPRSVVRGIVEYHIIFNAWNTTQLTITDGKGKIDPTDPNRNEPTAFKKRTVYQDSIYQIRVADDRFQPRIVRSGGTSSRKVFNYGYKYAPIFYSSYLDLMELTSDDYEFFYNRPFESSSLYYAGAKLVPDEGTTVNVNIPAENGFIHIIDKVVPPVPNFEQRLLASEGQSHSYVKFLDLIRSYPILEEDIDKTQSQPGYNQGINTDPIFLAFYNPNMMPFSIGLELLDGANSGNDNAVLHNTLFAPTDEAFDKLIDEITGYPNWRNYQDLPDEVKELIIRSYCRFGSTYKKDLEKGFLNYEGDSLFGGFGTLGLDNIVDKEFLSNGMFMGLNEPIIPRALSSVAGPIYLRQEYDLYRKLLNYNGILSTLKNTSERYTCCVIDNSTFAQDSFLNVYDQELMLGGQLRRIYGFSYFDRRDESAAEKWYTRDDLGLLLNMIMEEEPTGNADLEFVKTLAGNYATFERQLDGRIVLQGSDASMRGISSQDTIIYPKKLADFEADNGTVLEVSAFLNFSTVTKLFGTVKTLGAGQKASNNTTITKYGFYDLLVVADLVDPIRSEFKFTADGQFYTVCIPTLQALADYEEVEGIQLHLLPKEALQQFLKYHFIQGALLFTDGKSPSGYYKTMRLSETSTNLNKVYNSIEMGSSPDNLEIRDINHNPYISIKPNRGRTNVLTYNSGTAAENSLYVPHYTTGVVHMVDAVLVYEAN